MSGHRLTVLLAILPVACAGPPPAPTPGNQVGSMGAPVMDVAADRAPPAATASAAVPDDSAWLGRWTGVEGMVLDVVRGAAPGRYRLTMQYDLDHRQVADGRLVDGALTFERDGQTLALRPTGGDATGLKYLAGKTDCLTVRSGEGYCR